MGTRIGIELAPADCRIVEIDAAAPGEDTRVRSLMVLARSGGATQSQLANLRGREAAVVAWGLRGDYRQAIVRAGRYDAMRREAIDSLRSAGINTRGVLSDIAPAGPAIGNGSRRPVVMALAARNEVASVLRPLTEAGIRVRSVVTPGGALGSIARLRRGRGAVSGVEAYVALEEHATCIALVRQHVVAAARELPWGYLHESEPLGERVPREKVAARLAGELVDFFSTSGVAPGSISVVCICGTLPELRSMTMLLMEQLDIEVEPMDSMFGVDPELQSEETKPFRERGIELRLAWAAAADWNAPLNLLRERRGRAMAAVFARAAVVAGVGAGVTLGWGMQQATWLKAAGRVTGATRVREAREPLAAMPSPAAAARVHEPVRVELPRPREAEPTVRALAAQVGVDPEPARPEPETVAPPRTTAADVARAGGIGATPAAADKLIARRNAPPIMHEPQMPAEPVSPPTSAAPGAAGPVPSARKLSDAPALSQEPRRPLMDVPESDAAELGSVLFGSDRRLAMIDGRIVEMGDEIAGARVVEIGPTSVTLRERTGQLRKLSLGVKRR